MPALALPLARRSAAACGPARLGAGPGPATRAPLGRLPSRLSLRLAACDFFGMRAARRPGTNAPWLPCQIAAAAFPALARCKAPWLRDRAAAAARPRVGGSVAPPCWSLPCRRPLPAAAPPCARRGFICCVGGAARRGFAAVRGLGCVGSPSQGGGAIRPYGRPLGGPPRSAVRPPFGVGGGRQLFYRRHWRRVTAAALRRPLPRR